MNIDAIVQDTAQFVQENVVVAVIIGLFVLFLLFRHPKVLLSIIIFFMLAYGLAALFEMLSTKGLG